MSTFAAFDELLKTVTELEQRGKGMMKTVQCVKAPCECSCHVDASIIHIGPPCCEKTLAE